MNEEQATSTAALYNVLPSLSLLSTEEQRLLAENNLGFSGYIVGEGIFEVIELLPVKMGNGHWLASCKTLPAGIEEYTKRPIPLRGLPYMAFIDRSIKKGTRIVKLYKNVDPGFEAELHRTFECYRLHGEWFSEEVLDLEKDNSAKGH